ncbi:MAG: hypothetical protein QM669_14190 [Siphonobacter sp.]
MSIHRLRILFFWVITTVCMILHFNFHVGDLFYGIDLVQSGANGQKPNSLVIIRFIFEIFPLLWATFLFYLQSIEWRRANFFLSILFTLAHIGHVLGELKEGDPSQLLLLTFVMGISILLTLESWKWIKVNNFSPDYKEKAGY